MNANVQADTTPEQMKSLLQRQKQAFVAEGHVTADVRIGRLQKALIIFFYFRWPNFL